DRLDRYNVSARGEQQPGELPGTGGDVGDAPAGRDGERVHDPGDRVVRVRRTGAVVCGRFAPEPGRGDVMDGHRYHANRERSLSWRFHRRSAVGSSPTGPSFVELHVVMTAVHPQVVEVGRTPVDPVSLVMDVAPFGWSVATGPRTAAVAQHDCPALRRADDAGAASEIEDLAVAVAHDPPEDRVARQPPDG